MILVFRFLIQALEDEFIITVGQLAPPALIGEEAERIEQLNAIEFVPVKVVGRFGLTAQRMRELVKALNENLECYDSQKAMRLDE